MPLKPELRRETYLMRLPVQKCSKKRTLCCLLLKSDWLGCDGEHASNLHICLSLHCHFQTIISNMFFVDNFTRSVWPFLDIWWDADVFGIAFWPAREYADVHAWLIDDRYKPSKTKAWQPHYWLSEMTIWIESRDVLEHTLSSLPSMLPVHHGNHTSECHLAKPFFVRKNHLCKSFWELSNAATHRRVDPEASGSRPIWGDCATWGDSRGEGFVLCV